MRNILFIIALILIPLSVSCNNTPQESSSDGETETGQEMEVAEESMDEAQEMAEESEQNGGINKDKLITFFKNKYGAQLPSGLQIAIPELTGSDMDGFQKGSYEVEVPGRGKQSVPFLVSDEGRYLIIGANSPVNIDSFEDSPVKGLKQGSLNVGRGPIPVLISDDGKKILVGELLDTSVNPLKEITDKISLENSPSKGNENAPVTVVEYSDFQCPFCKKGSAMLPQILDEFKDNVKIVFKQLPLANHKWAKPAAIASLCSYEQGTDKFWEFHDSIFAKQQEINVDNSDAKLKEIAENTGLDMAAYESCIKSEEIAERVQSDIKEAQEIGVSSTPTFVVDGLIVPGANLEALKNAIESRLSQGG